LHHHHDGEWSGTLLIQTLPSLVLKLVFGKVNLLCTNFFNRLQK